MKFELDSKKANFNLKKHSIFFEEAQTVFNDPFACIFDYELHSVEEQREIIIGYSMNHRLLIVSFVERHGIIRIISARHASTNERKDYENHQRC